MANNQLEELFSRLKAQKSDQPRAESPIWTTSTSLPYQQPAVSSPILSPPSQTPNPVHSSNIISPVNPASAVGSPAPDQNRTNNLLNLLKFNNQGSQAGPMASLQNVGGLRSGSTALPAAEGHEAAQARPLSAQDLMASFQRKPSSQNVVSSPLVGARAGAEKPELVTSPSNNSKDFLLNLLTKPKEPKPVTQIAGSQADSAQPVAQDENNAAVNMLTQSFAETSVDSSTLGQPQHGSTPTRHFGSADPEKTSFEAPQPTKPTIFNYVNPFDQLHSSSPLNQSSSMANDQTEPRKFEILKHNRETSSTLHTETSGPALKTRKLASAGGSPTPSPAPVEPEKAKSVSEAIEGVGKTVDEQVKEAFAQADLQEKDANIRKTIPAQTGDNAADDDVPIKKESAVDDDVESSWESAEDEEAEKAEEFKVEVYNFPMKPFVSIRIKNMDTPRPIRQDNFMNIAQMKKEFDQIDRCLVSASQTHIVYAQAATKKDNGGFRIIRQDTGHHKQIFRSTGERVFNVQLCTSPGPAGDVGQETILGTGVDGSIFWTSLDKSRGELFQDDDVEAQGFIMPPVPTPEEQTSGSQVKTRAKMSSRHPEYFAASRGKQINIIATEVVKRNEYCDSKTRRVNSEKYLSEHGLRIMTVKACKDFCFSEDDTMIVSLDKSGRFKFWDVKDLTSRASDTSEGKHEPVELREPIWSLTAGTSGSKADEKSSVSSIMFLDKARPTQRGAALRYMLIGFKQNHILQLWDLGLGKAVQEIRLPHEKDSDGICSLTYHPGSGIIALGHPTRNSVYFIHLSAPKYNFPYMDQAKYVNLLARNDTATIPRPESTAIMSGLREFSFAKVGQLRSLDMLRQPMESSSDSNDEDATLFELYIMHHKGAVTMSVKRKDLGWDKDSKMVKPIDGGEAGIIEVTELIPPQKLPGASEQSSNADAPAKAIVKPTATKKHELVKPPVSGAPKTDNIKKEVEQPSTPIANGSTAGAGSKQVTETPTRPQQSATNTSPSGPDSYAMAAQRASSPTREKALQDAANAAKMVASSPSDAVSAPAVSSNDDLQSMMSKQFDALYDRINADKRVQDAASSAKQDAVLRLVESILTENVEKSLNRIVSENMTKEIVPNVSNNVNKAIEKKLSDTLPQHLNSQLTKEIKAAMPNAIQQALKDPHVHNTISNQVSQKVQQQVSQLLQQSMPNLATQATQKMVTDLENRTKQQLRDAETRRQQDNAKIQELSNLVHGLSQMVQNMSESQAAFQDQILKMQRPSSKARQESSRDADSAAELAADPQKTAEEEEAEKITNLLMAGEYDAATIAWLQSTRQGELFDQVFLRVNPRYLEKVAPLVALSVSAAITASFESHVSQRLEWLSTVLNIINLEETEIKEVAPKIMEVLSQRLQGAYMNISEANPSEPALRRISALNRQIMEVRRLAG